MLVFFGVFTFSLFFSLLFNGLIKKFCQKHNILDFPNPRKIHQKPTPRLGGVAIYLAFLGAVILGVKLNPQSLIEVKPFLLPIFIGSLVIVGFGVYDDLREVSPIAKLLIQIALGIFLIWGGLKIKFFRIPFWGSWELSPFSSTILTLIWFVLITNTINLIDGLDGLAGGVTLIVCVTLLLVGWHLDLNSILLLSFALLGAVLGFLKYNFFPAQLFMGDSGSLFLGYYFAVITIIFPIKTFSTISMFVPLLVLTVPLMETFFSFFRRILAKKKFYQADQSHVHHFLLKKGWSQKRIVLVFWGVSLIFSGVSLGMLFRLNKALFSAITLLLFLLIFIFLLSQMRWERKTKEGSCRI